MLIEIEKVLLKEKPELMLVYGDMNSTMAGALAAVKLHIRWRMWKRTALTRSMPKEDNRVLADQVSAKLSKLPLTCNTS
jgi:UDP-N-acetylglucosamine 2-epimerase